MNSLPTLHHVFRHDGRWYFSDAATSDVYECDEVVAAVLLVWENSGPVRELPDLVKRWGAERVAAALGEIDDLMRTTGALAPPSLSFLTSCADCHDPAAYRNEIQHLQLTVSEQCSLRCGYCPHTCQAPLSRPHRDVYMSEDVARQAIDFYLAHSEDVEEPGVSFYGGEPLLQKELLAKVISYTRSRPAGGRVRFNLDTNGIHIDRETARFLNREQVRVQISLDGPAHVHDRYRRTPSGAGSHAAVMAGLEHLLSDDPTAHERINFNATLAPPFEIEAVLDFFEDFQPYRQRGIAKPPLARIQFANVSGFSFEPRDLGVGTVVNASEAVQKAHERYLAACRTGKHDLLSPAHRSLFDKGLTGYHHRPMTVMSERMFPTGSCQPGQRKIHVKADGTLLPCERGNDRMAIGHLAGGIDLKAVDELYASLVAAVGERCRNCWAIRNCTVCFIHMAASWDSRKESGAVVPEEICLAVRTAQESTLKDYLTLEKSGPQALAWLDETTIA